MSTRIYRASAPVYGNDWKSGLELIKAQREELEQYQYMMTDYERTVAQREMKSTLDTWKPRIIQALVEEQKTAINDYRYAETKVKSADKAEVNRWEASRLRAEMELAQALVAQAQSGKHTAGAFDGGSPSTYKRIEAVYQDAQKSGDLFKQRAICEVLQGVEIGKDEFEMNHLRKQAERDLSTLRRLPEQAQAEAEREAAWSKVLEKTREIVHTAPQIGEDATGPYAAAFELGRAVNRVKIREDGARVILEPDDPEIRGVYVRGSKPVNEGESA